MTYLRTLQVQHYMKSNVSLKYYLEDHSSIMNASCNIHDNQFVNAFSRKIVFYFPLSTKVQERQLCFSPEMPGVEIEEASSYLLFSLMPRVSPLGVLIYQERGSSSRFHILVCLTLWAFQGSDNWCSSSISLTNILKEKLGFSVFHLSGFSPSLRILTFLPVLRVRYLNDI